MALRLSCQAYARTVMPAVLAVSQPKVAAFMQQHTLHKDEPSMTALIKRFVGWVKVVQRGFRRVQMMRRARVEALLERFLAAKLADPACAATAHHPAKHPQPPIAFCCAPPAKAAAAD